MKISAMPVTDDLDQYGHLYSDELRESIVSHYVDKYRCQGRQASKSPAAVRSWVAGTAGATTRAEKIAVLERILSA
jgi:hypothetical protein